jgi:hypothetical protein
MCERDRLLPQLMTTLTRGDAMIQSHEPAILDLGIISFQEAIRSVAAGILDGPAPVEVTHFRRVEHLMRIAVALGGVGNGPPFVEFHGIPAVNGPRSFPEILSVALTDLLAARAADHLPAALESDPEALRAFEEEAERLLETEDIQLV